MEAVEVEAVVDRDLLEPQEQMVEQEVTRVRVVEQEARVISLELLAMEVLEPQDLTTHTL